MKRIVALAITIILISPMCHGITRPDGMGYAFTAIADDLNAIDYNPAGLAFMKSDQMMYGYRCFPLEENTNLYELAISEHFGDNTIALETYGFDQYLSDYATHYHLSTISYAGKVADNFAVGINLRSTDEHLYSVSGPKENMLFGYSADIGVLLKPNKYFSLGVMQNAVLFPQITDFTGGEKVHYSIPSPLRVGIALFPLEGLILAFDAVKDVNVEFQQWDDCYGIEYDIASLLTIRGGRRKHYYSDDIFIDSSTFGLTLNITPGIKLDMARVNSDNSRLGDENSVVDYYGFRWDF